MMAAYSGAFISHLTVKDLQLPFTTFEGILNDGRYRIVAVKGTAQLNYYDVSTPT
jgi:hypothetical protein